ncbi:HlyD family type I secretion periplasmic adaptor subunit [Salmonella enterica subsp. enterica]|nr:HlyD family type I secretion periplasmic adaptor subunit [Salmonella enterica subsp. enterica serovar Paratyphi A]
MGRYWQAIRAGIERERAAKRPSLNRNEREFQPAAIEILETPASPTTRIFTLLIIIFVGGAAVWSWFGRIDTTATLEGKIIPVGKVQIIQPLVAGRVQAIHVRGGDHVAAGQALIDLDPTEHTAERVKLVGSLTLEQLSVSRLRSLVDAVEQDRDALELASPPSASAVVVNLQRLQMRQSLAAYRAEQASFVADIEQKKVEIDRAGRTLEERRKLVDVTGDRLEIFQELEKRGVGVKSNTLDALQGEQDQLLSLTAEEGRIAELKSTVLALEARKIERRQAYLDKLATELIEADRQANLLAQDLAKAELLERASTLAAPVPGRVQQLQVNTLGQVVQAGQQLMVIVPDDLPLEVEANLLNRDKGFVREGQSARVKLEAFPFTKYGTLSGKVLAVSNDSVPLGERQTGSPGPLVFPVRISLDASSIEADGETVALTPGMSVSAEVKTGNRRVLEYLLDPLIEMQDEAFHER